MGAGADGRCAALCLLGLDAAGSGGNASGGNARDERSELLHALLGVCCARPARGGSRLAALRAREGCLELLEALCRRGALGASPAPLEPFGAGADEMAPTADGVLAHVAHMCAALPDSPLPPAETHAAGAAASLHAALARGSGRARVAPLRVLAAEEEAEEEAALSEMHAAGWTLRTAAVLLAGTAQAGAAQAGALVEMLVGRAAGDAARGDAWAPGKLQALLEWALPEEEERAGELALPAPPAGLALSSAELEECRTCAAPWAPELRWYDARRLAALLAARARASASPQRAAVEAELFVLAATAPGVSPNARRKRLSAQQHLLCAARDLARTLLAPAAPAAAARALPALPGPAGSPGPGPPAGGAEAPPELPERGLGLGVRSARAQALALSRLVVHCLVPGLRRAAATPELGEHAAALLREAAVALAAVPADAEGEWLGARLLAALEAVAPLPGMARAAAGHAGAGPATGGALWCALLALLCALRRGAGAWPEAGRAAEVLVAQRREELLPLVARDAAAAGGGGGEEGLDGEAAWEWRGAAVLLVGALLPLRSPRAGGAGGAGGAGASAASSLRGRSALGGASLSLAGSMGAGAVPLGAVLERVGLQSLRELTADLAGLTSLAERLATSDPAVLRAAPAPGARGALVLADLAGGPDAGAAEAEVEAGAGAGAELRALLALYECRMEVLLALARDRQGAEALRAAAVPDCLAGSALLRGQAWGAVQRAGGLAGGEGGAAAGFRAALRPALLLWRSLLAAPVEVGGAGGGADALGASGLRFLWCHLDLARALLALPAPQPVAARAPGVGAVRALCGAEWQREGGAERGAAPELGAGPEGEQQLLVEVLWRLDARGALDRGHTDFYAEEVRRGVCQGARELAAALARQARDSRLWLEGAEDAGARAAATLEHSLRLLLQRAGGREAAAAVDAPGASMRLDALSGDGGLSEAEAPFDCSALLQRAPCADEAGEGLGAALVADLVAVATQEARDAWHALAAPLHAGAAPNPRARVRVERAVRLASISLALLAAAATAQAAPDKAAGAAGPMAMARGAPPESSTAGTVLRESGRLLALCREVSLARESRASASDPALARLRANLGLVQVPGPRPAPAARPRPRSLTLQAARRRTRSCARCCKQFLRALL